MAAVNPYINYEGTCEDAFNFYKSVFGGDFQAIMRWGEMPGCEEMNLSESDKSKVMHVALPISDGSILMGSDHLESAPHKLTVGNNITVAIGAESREEADRLFAGLSDGGTVMMPMADAFWGGYFGMFIDKFGIQWLINFGQN